jgi:hypothetical protein
MPEDHEASPLSFAHCVGGCGRNGQVGRSVKGSGSTVEKQLAPPQAANSGREIGFETLRARAPESHVVRENDVAAVFTNLPPILKNFHHPECLP